MPRYAEENGKGANLDLHSFGDTRGVLISTMNDIPGYRVVHVISTVYGLTVRSRNVVASVGANFKSLIGGEVGVFTKMLYDSRNSAVDRMISECLAKGGNAIIAMRFESGELEGRFAEVCAYGTACIVEKIN
ncbi:putative heavy-metal-binding-domain-containing protein [Lipomyces doorenjongii]|uniref:putative heavy-metal-binding-domain-containing protein n=1 Tax=Lipomyces doorenjongii TaxID=383834 RepID=UPI003344239D